MPSCWTLVGFARVTGLPTARVEPCRQKVAELLALLEGEPVTGVVKLTLPCLGQCRSKLLVVASEPGAALGADHGPLLHPANLLCELVEAMRARKRPKILVLVHDATICPGAAPGYRKPQRWRASILVSPVARQT